ncbi:MAG TPA: hypothetical protein VMS17_29555, partial [Gemmataceae bacterium]|nr:hypothetical protein [Gemmataceae bacterium]
MSSEEYTWRPPPPGPPPPPPRIQPTPRTSPAVVLLVLLTIGGWILAGFLIWRNVWGPGPGSSPVDALPRTVTPRGDLMQIETTTEKIYEDTRPSVVYITTLGRRRTWNLNVQEVPKGTGSGFIWNVDDKAGIGFIVTNYHVVKDVVRDNGDG